MKLRNLRKDKLKEVANSMDIQATKEKICYDKQNSLDNRVPLKNPWEEKCTLTEIVHWMSIPKNALTDEEVSEMRKNSELNTPELEMPYKEFIQMQVRNFLEINRNHPTLVIQRKIIDLYKDRKFKLRKQVTFGSLCWKKGSIGFTLDAASLGKLPTQAIELLEKQLQKPDVSLCCLDEYIYTLPNEYLNFGKEEEEGVMGLF